MHWGILDLKRKLNIKDFKFKLITYITSVYSTSTNRKDTFGRPRRRFDLEEIDINMKNWVDSAQDKNYWKALLSEAYLRIP